MVFFMGSGWIDGLEGNCSIIIGWFVRIRRDTISMNISFLQMRRTRISSCWAYQVWGSCKQVMFADLFIQINLCHIFLIYSHDDHHTYNLGHDVYGCCLGLNLIGFWIYDIWDSNLRFFYLNVLTWYVCTLVTCLTVYSETCCIYLECVFESPMFWLEFLVLPCLFKFF